MRRDANAFDAANPDATVLNREARRCIATTQPNSDKWLHAVPEPSLPHTIIPSIRSTIAVQRRLGLYLTAGKNVYDARAQMDHVTVSQSDRLGDSILNKDSKTHRHNLVNKAVYDAANAQATTSVILGDKGEMAPNETEKRPWNDMLSITRTTYQTSSSKVLPRTAKQYYTRPSATRGLSLWSTTAPVRRGPAASPRPRWGTA